MCVNSRGGCAYLYVSVFAYTMYKENVGMHVMLFFILASVFFVAPTTLLAPSLFPLPPECFLWKDMRSFHFFFLLA
jgi:hypothetical protein